MSNFMIRVAFFLTYILFENIPDKSSKIHAQPYSQSKKRSHSFCHVFAFWTFLSVICYLPDQLLQKLYCRPNILFRRISHFSFHCQKAMIADFIQRF